MTPCPQPVAADICAALLSRLFADHEAETMLRNVLTGDLAGRIAMVSSFGAESVALLHILSRVDPATPVIFLDTEMLFPETLAYQREVADTLGLTDVRIIRPEATAVAAEDPAGDLNARDPDACCALRKTRPLAAALEGFAGWITGRKAFQNGQRARLPKFEVDGDGRLKLNPLADWSAAELSEYMDAHDLPRHPLVARGYPSIGCAPCTSPVAPGEDARAGRWRGSEKTECGIHFVDGQWRRGAA